MLDKNLKVTEIFLSIQGESTLVGLPTVFVRLTGCPLRCQYCDTTYAFTGGVRKSIQQVLDEVSAYEVQNITVTGGEPLAQNACLDLLQVLCDRGYRVSLETSGALDVAAVDPRVIKVIDMKTPGSGEVSRNLMANFKHLLAHDQVKFVLCDRDDYNWSKAMLSQLSFAEGCEVLFSPSAGQLDATVLAEWILADRLKVRLQTQLHKQLWGDAAGR